MTDEEQKMINEARELAQHLSQKEAWLVMALEVKKLRKLYEEGKGL